METVTQLHSRLEVLLFVGMPPTKLNAFRRCIAATFIAYFVFRLPHAREWLTDFGFHTTGDAIPSGRPTAWMTMPGWMIVPFAAIVFISRDLGGVGVQEQDL